MSSEHDTIVRNWQQNAQGHDQANTRFLRSLKMCDVPSMQIDQVAQDLHAEAFSKVDCTQRHYCCKTMSVILTEKDARRIASHLGMSKKDFVQTYLEAHEEGYKMRQRPCPLLGDDDRCTVYEVRPAVCRGYPYTDKKDFVSRTFMHSANCLRCPAVFYVVERLREEL